MSSDTESATHTGMEPMSSHQYLLLQVWCGLLTLALVLMAACPSLVKPKTIKDEVSTLKPDVSPAVNTIAAPFKSEGSSLSYIQLIKSPDSRSWQEHSSCDSCSLVLRDDSIHCSKDSLYLLYAQVTFSKHPGKSPDKAVILIRNPQFGKRVRKLAEGIFPHTTEGSVWVANVIRLSEGDSVSINITGDFLTDHTFWGACQLH